MKSWFKNNEDWVLPLAFIAFGWGAWWALFGASARQQNQNINPAIYSSFRSIENQCFAELWPRQTVRCVNALSYMNSCSGIKVGCSLIDYYNELYSYGFELPPLYLNKGE